MTENGRTRGKVIEFTPRKKPKLKKLDYVDPEQKKLREKRQRQRQISLNRGKTLRYVGIFIGLCVLVFILKELF